MPPTPTIDRGIVTSIVTAIDASQGDLRQLVEASGLASLWSNLDVEAIPEDRVWKLFELGAHSLDMPDIGVRVGSKFQIRDLGEFGRKLENSLTVFSCLSEYIKTVNRYSSHSRFWLDVEEGGAWFCRRGIDLIDVGRREVEQFTLELMIRLAQLACGQSWIPPKITIKESSDRFLREDSRYDSAIIRCLQPSTAIWVPSLDLLKTVSWSDDEIVELIRDRISLDCNIETPTLPSVAQQLGFSVRTLQRELSANGLDWSRLLDQVRLCHATERLRTDMPLADIAHELRYTDQANFGRAFRRWTGTSPRAYRRLAGE